MALDLMSLVARLSIDSSEYEEGLEKAEKRSGMFADFLKANLITKGVEVCVKGLARLGGAAANVFKGAIDSYADYEQLVGGVETLFKGSADTVMKNAEKAYQTAGMSANEYMKTVTGFSAALIQSTGRGAQTDLDALEKNLDDQYTAVKRHWDDRIRATKDAGKKASMRYQMEDELKALKEHNKEVLKQAEAANQASVTTPKSLAKAAELADLAIQDMSDNANKMGSDMSSIQSAYQGFAKQNYTMLDNLKLGYGGTKEEMERLLKDAEKLTGKKYKLSSYADIVEAIHAIQTEMGITGTTAEEASKTISGSIGMLKSAWANLITGMGEGNEVKLDGLVNAVVDAAKTVFANVMPVAEKAIYGFIHLIEASVPVLLETVPGMVSRLAPRLVKAAGTLVTSIAKSLPSLMRGIVKKLPQALKKVERFLLVWVFGTMGRLLSNLAGYKIQTNQSIFQNVFTRVMDLLRKIADKAKEFWKVVVQPIIQDGAKLIQGLVRAVIHLLDGLKPIWDEVSPKISEAFQAIADFWHNTLYPVLDDIVFFVITWLVPRIIEWVGKAVDFVGKAFKAIEQFWRDPLYPILKRIWVYISETVVPKAVEAWGIFRDKIKEVFDKISQWWDDSGKDLFDKVKKFITETLVEKMGEFYKNVLSPIIESLGGMEGIIDLLMKGIAGYIAAKSISTALGAIHGLITKITEGFIGLNAAIEAFAPRLIILAEIVALYQEIKQLLGTDNEYKKLYSGSRESVQKNLDEYKRLYETQGKEVADAYASAWVDVGKLDYNDSVRLLEYALEQQFTDIPKNLWDGFAKGWRYYFGGAGQKGVGINQLVEDAFVNAIANIRILLGLDKDESESYIIAADIVEGFKTGLEGIKTWFEELGEAILRRIKTIANVIIRGINTYILTPIENAINKIISGLNKIPGVALNDVTLGKISEFALEANYGAGRNKGYGRHDFFANGGILGEGQSAFVGEYAPELLRVIGGKAMVTPLSKVPARFPGGPETFEPRVAQSRPVTVIMQVGEKEFGRLAFELGSAEEQRVGVRLAKGGAY